MISLFINNNEKKQQTTQILLQLITNIKLHFVWMANITQ